ncbi:MAG: hypothetical protein A2499_16595 [Stygiobacter sp. RIFOXYC12_FULL_38_8]|nr:MAG: hypothetical protein A2X62_04880 [Stygiobacter sp. GWC2_38_9]OGU81266.1 MAG: hypothetical protein A2279_11705 [Stygiobacter sp. RIFOXYA12_FULL_38_9]OGV08602.1 MAG: hypothetical protein A2299_17170 [Stygiobacter sp. RIFOXYB2_FULL_37_11]OGV11829.1 MAG: hypothetical protein A2237_07230 [Stygiobacter sp. RIFOXYA2_FULL_38_8]OGV12511.1 MAG: hypothetical protein A2440_14765 [Stygiobacter sp. RIFOXYC2_FULL_38_25]OGV24141.1 MAG: hypothetical protein A2499_16595 [Stygiobacter sp. RIFOXYC12_FULL_
MTHRICFNNHPIELFFSKILPQLPSEAELSFSAYTYKPQSIIELRETKKFLVREIDITLIENLFASLDKNQEFAINSAIKFPDGNIKHIPMIDFLTGSIKTVRSIMPLIIQYPIIENMYIYDSGSSYHGYSTYLIDEKSWVKYMGLLLLLNLPGKEPIIDYRWIGHRLNAGYGTLRWTSNSKKHLHEPRYLFGLRKNEATRNNSIIDEIDLKAIPQEDLFLSL